MRALVLRAAGTNCDGETVAALERAGADVERVHVNRLALDPGLLDRSGLLVLPGGFTFGDDVASGAVLAYTIEQRLRDALQAFVASGRKVLGICNGFQVLVRLGLLPGEGRRAALLPNRSGRFEDRWVRLRATDALPQWLTPGAEYLIPVAHAEGRFQTFDDTPLPGSQIALRYVGDDDGGDQGGPAPYPANPNGSERDIAGITNPAGNVLGMMPHPERFLFPYQHPSWTRLRRPDGSLPSEEDLPVPLGLDVYRRAVSG